MVDHVEDDEKAEKSSEETKVNFDFSIPLDSSRLREVEMEEDSVPKEESVGEGKVGMEEKDETDENEKNI